MSRKLPSQIKILGKTFSVSYVPNLRDEDKEALYGDTDGRAYHIRINSNYSTEIQEVTLFHEAIHAALSVSGICHMLDEKGEEALVSCLENAFGEVVDIHGLAANIDTRRKSKV